MLKGLLLYNKKFNFFAFLPDFYLNFLSKYMNTKLGKMIVRKSVLDVKTLGETRWGSKVKKVGLLLYFLMDS